MSEQFDWQIGEDEDGLAPQRHTAVSHKSSRLWVWLGLTAVLVFGLWWAGHSWQDQLSSAERSLQQQAQTALDFERDAYLAGDGELFYSFQATDPAWFAAQLNPLNGRLYQHNPQISHAQQQNNFIWANVQWTESGQTFQRVAFWQIQPDGGLIRQPEAPGYWGSFTFVDFAWGQLNYFQTDSDLSEQIGQHVTETLAVLCTTNCPTAERPFTLTLANDFAETAAPDHLRLPSPRLVGLDENGAPSDLFWQLLDGRLADRFGKVTLRFAIPASKYPLIDYEMAAAEFMEKNPHIAIELVQLDSLPDDLAAVARSFDGAAMTPSVGLIAAGLVYDLTYLANTDPYFDQADFYEQIWQGSQWRGRTWFMPQAASLPVLFYDRMAYYHAGISEPSLRWTWDEMAQDVATLVAAQPEDSDLSWAFLDINNDALLSYAYNWNSSCAQAVSVLCSPTLPTANIAAALDWYHQLATQPGLMPDITGLSPAERESALLNWQASRRRVAIWVDQPLAYELHLLLNPIGVVPFPGSDRFDGITPLQVRGNFISQQSERPFAMWQWLKFLSYYPPSGGFRLVPARPSVADQAHYWNTLPRPLGDAMRTAFPFSRPVSLEEQAYFPPEQLTAVAAGVTSPQEAAQHRPRWQWFQ